MFLNANRVRFSLKFSENKRKLTLIGLILLIFIFVQSRKSDECWSKLTFVRIQRQNEEKCNVL